MEKRTWPYGTRKSCVVAGVLEAGNTRTTVCFESSDPGEAFILVSRRTGETRTTGDKVELVFTEGGSTGGYWEIESRGEPQ